MVRTLMGLETEYAVAGTKLNGQPANRAWLARSILHGLRESRPTVVDGMRGVFLGNGARVYIDAGTHPEYATPECSNPWEAVAHLRAGDHIMVSQAEAAKERDPQVVDVTVSRANVDYSGLGTTWACHESYLHRCSPADLPPELVPHFVTRVLYTGAGGFHPLKPTPEFTLSPRAWLLTQEISGNSTHTRGIFHTKDEPLSPSGYHRLHVLCGEGLASDVGSVLKLGTTALILAAVECGARPGAAVPLSSPVQALRKTITDPTLRAAVPLRDGRRMTALQIQRHYLEVVETHLADLPEWAPALCRMWARVLDAMECDGIEGISRTIDWAIKLPLLRSLDPVPPPAPPDSVPSEQMELPLPLVHLFRRRRAAPTPPFLPPGHRLFEADLRFGEVGAGGTFRALDDAGLLDHRLVSDAEVERAVAAPPSSGRARARGRWVDRVGGLSSADRYRCYWTELVDIAKGRRLDFRDPFRERVRWRRWESEV